MKKFIWLVGFSTALLAQEKKSTYVFSNEIVTIKNETALSVESFIEEKKHIAESKDVGNFYIQIPFDNFTEVLNIKGSTTNLDTKKVKQLYAYSISTVESQNDNIFHSDKKIKRFVMPDVTNNSEIYYSYNLKHKDPHLLSGFYFQNELKTQTAKLKIICDEGIELGYKLFGNQQDKIKFTTSKQGTSTVYEWEAQELPEFKYEEGMPNPTYFLPHIIYYVKSYTQNGEKKVFLNDVSNLYKWYKSLLKDINKANQDALTTKAKELTTTAKTEVEKAEAIYTWVQENLNYVAFEYEMGGFIPRDAGDVFAKKYGDCKDMANLLNEMFKAVGLESYLTWIGTRDKNYSYQEVPTPLVDNHMITAVKINQKYYFFDATDKYCPALFPTEMIQDKEALIGINDSEFVIEKVKTTEPEHNKILANVQFSFTDKKLNGTADVNYSGYRKSELLNYLGANNQDVSEIWKSFLSRSNEKLAITEVEKNKNQYKNVPATAKFTLQLADWIKDIGDKKMFKPVILQPLYGRTIDTEHRTYAVEKDLAYTYEVNYEIQLPENYSPESLPQNVKIENDLLFFETNYSFKNNKLNIFQKIKSKKILVHTPEFDLWNATIAQITKTSNQSILLKK